MKTRFWMVYGLGKYQPTVMHSSRMSADQEAERLARIHSPDEFVVLESIASVQKRDVHWENYDDEIQPRGDLPF